MGALHGDLGSYVHLGARALDLLREADTVDDLPLDETPGLDPGSAHGHRLVAEVDAEHTADLARDAFVAPARVVGDDLLEVDGLTDPYGCAPKVPDEVAELAQRPGRVLVAEEDVEPRAAGRWRLARPHDDLRHEQNGPPGLALCGDEPLDEGRLRVALLGQADGPHEQKRMSAGAHCVRELPGRIEVVRALPHAAPSARDPRPRPAEEREVDAVREGGEGGADLQEQVVEEQVVQEAAGPHDVDHLAARRQGPEALRHVFGQLDVVEHLATEPAEERSRTLEHRASEAAQGARGARRHGHWPP